MRGHLSPSVQEVLRLRAVAALVAGRDREDVASVCGVSLKAVDKWWMKWRAGGRDALFARPKGRPAGVHQALGEVEQPWCGGRYLITGRVTWACPASCGRVPWWVD
ncbi:helix-turn-helix domain-containing protein [Streptomyces sp. JV190]|uniref:helix-turn-helix domain-containing protein n=1 Tax=Streptomyces sp. JV190 TaxID=3002533 RepID=UPI002E7A38A0|nr:helix-turn-helix domain-containing protein [Streptomyces sp. JV190]